MTQSARGIKQDDRGVYDLRALYEGMGYRKFKMSKFEEYELYLENKSFLETDGIVTFTGPTGRLLALKPDVTLSILKNTRDGAHLPQKLYYTENVYRARSGSREIREIMQVGLEYIGEIDLYARVEAVTLAAESLAALDAEYVLDISHMGLVRAILDEAALRESVEREVLSCISSKNEHELIRILEREGVTNGAKERLCALPTLGGEVFSTLQKAKRLAQGAAEQLAVTELESLFCVLRETMDVSHLRLDFSIVNDMSYYNGLIFRGYIPDVPTGILAGGQYDNLVRRLSKAPGAIGFAVYLDLLENRPEPAAEFDVDVLLLCSGDDKALEAAKLAKQFRREGKSVRVQADAGKIRARETVVL